MFYTRFYKIWWQIGPFHSLNQHWGIVHPQSVSYVFFTHRLIKILKYFFNSARKFCFYGNNLFLSRLAVREISGAAPSYEEILRFSLLLSGCYFTIWTGTAYIGVPSRTGLTDHIPASLVKMKNSTNFQEKIIN